MTELLVGTKKGLFVLEGAPGEDFRITRGRSRAEPVDYALRDPRTGRALAGVTNPFYGPKIWFTDDLTGDWQQAEGVELPPGGSAALERIWGDRSGRKGGAAVRRRRSRRALPER